jgi:hypothetical protein
MATSTIFRNFTIPVEDKSLMLIAKDIASDKYKVQVEEIRNLNTQGKKQEADNKKKQLLAFTPSATFKEKRQLPLLVMYSGFIHLDFDKLNEEELNNAFDIINQIPYTFLCFKSPSGNGLKVFIEVNTGLEQHELAYAKVLNFYEGKIGLKADPSCKDVTRLCFVSYDPQLYKNISNQKFIVDETLINIDVPMQPTEKKEIIAEDTNNLNAELIFNQQILFTNQKLSYENGNRNNYIYLLASNCNRVGLSQSDTEILCASHFDLSQREIQDAVKSAYTKHTMEFAKFAKSANLQSDKGVSQTPFKNNNTSEQSLNDEDPLEDYLTTPTIPDAVFENLPFILKEGARAFTDKRKRDVFFTGAISIISGCLPKVSGVYFQERVFPHLYTFIIAPAASGKGVLKNAKRLADKYHQKILHQSREAQKIHDAEMADFKHCFHSCRLQQSQND